MSTDVLLTICTCPDDDRARAIASALVERHLAACVNVTPPVTSVYRWDGRVETAAEVLMLIKTTRDRYPALERALRDLHPYEVPEIIAVPIDRGLHDYLQWVRLCTDAS
jgi:periplasmic divalent cation tolerance protein